MPKVNVMIKPATPEEVERNRKGLEMALSQICSRIAGKPVDVTVRKAGNKVDSA